jgi:hypothetical protein
LSGGTEESHKGVSQDSWSPGRDLNPGLPEYEAGVLTTLPSSSVVQWLACLLLDTIFAGSKNDKLLRVIKFHSTISFGEANAVRPKS